MILHLKPQIVSFTVSMLHVTIVDLSESVVCLTYNNTRMHRCQDLGKWPNVQIP